MRKYPSVAALRAHLAQALDTVEEGRPVEVTRRGRTFRIVEVLPDAKAVPRPKAWFVPDPELLERGWSWDVRPGEPARLVLGGKPRRS